METSASDHAPPGWVRVSQDVRGVPLWKRPDDTCYVATRDMEQLRFIDAALTRFDRMSALEFCAFVTP